MVESQAQAEKVRHKDYAESMAMGIRGGAESRARQIREDADIAARRVLDEIYPGFRSGVNYQMWTDDKKARADAIRKQAEDQERRVREMAEERVNEYKSWSEQQQKSVDDAAVSLQSQLKTSAAPGSVKLKPVGTGLFVRNYESSNPGKPAPDVRNSIVRIVPSGAPVEPVESEKLEKSVSGSILK